MPTPEDLAALGDAGRDLVARLLATHAVSEIEGALLLEAGHCADGLAVVRALPMDASSLAELNTAMRLEISWSRQLASLLSQLRISQ